MPLPQFSVNAKDDKDGFAAMRQDIGALCREARGPHNNRSSRDADNCHPISAITGLQAQLDSQLSAGGDTMTGTLTFSGTLGYIVMGTTGASSTAGALQRESNQDAYYTFTNGIGGWIDRCLFSQYATVTHTGAVTGQSLASATARGTRTMPANFFKPGKVLKFRLCGRYTTDVVPGTATIEVKLGSTSFRIASGFALDASSTNQPWAIEGEIVCQTTGATGTVEGVTWWMHGVTGAIANMDMEPMAGTGAVTLDTTASQAFDVLWTASGAGTVFSCSCFRLWEVC